jgi:hypothetical protein
MKQTTRWAVTVSSDVDRRVRRHLASVGRKGDLSGFIEETVKSRLLELSLKSVPTYSRRSANDVEAARDDSSETSGERYGR